MTPTSTGCPYCGGSGRFYALDIMSTTASASVPCPMCSPQPAKVGACSECAYFNSWGAGGLCRRHAPVRVDGGDAKWPGVRAHDWCGDFAAAGASK